ncbi:MAG: type II secretion system F family protein [Clostridiales bacterium]|nr:type II secretion system F family protein [Clostridiales bacterium]
MKTLFLFTVFLAPFFFVLGLGRLMELRQKQRMAKITGLEDDSAPEPYFPWLVHYFDRLQSQTEAAGIPTERARLQFITVAGGVLGFLLLYVATRHWALAIPGTALGLVAPPLYLRRLVTQRAEKFEAQLERAIAHIVNALRAGQSMANAIQEAANRAADPLAYEFHRVHQDLMLGTPLIAALEKLQRRVRSTDYDLFVATVSLQHTTGGDMIPMLQTIAETIRQRQQAKSKVEALTAPGRLSAGLVLVVPLILIGVLYVFTPDFFAVYLRPGFGQTLLFIAAATIAVGFFWIRRITDIRLE